MRVILHAIVLTGQLPVLTQIVDSELHFILNKTNSINIFYKAIVNYGQFEANGGNSINYGGAGGNGTITIGNISTGSFEKYQ